MVTELPTLGHRAGCPAAAQLRDDRTLLRRLRGSWLREEPCPPEQLALLAALLDRVLAELEECDESEGGALVVRSAGLWLADARAGSVSARSAVQNLALLVCGLLPDTPEIQGALLVLARALPPAELRELRFCPWGSRQLRTCPHSTTACAAQRWGSVLTQL